jgi:phage FluMu protein Com
MTVTEKVAYIRGLAEGLELDESKKEVKVLNAIIDVLEDISASVADVEDVVSDMEGQLDEVDEDLGTLERAVYDYDEDDEDGHTCTCGCEDDGDEAYYEVTCPNCHETICLSEDIFEDGQMECPNCGELLEFTLDEDEDAADEKTEKAEQKEDQ